MKAVFLHGKEDIRLEDIPKPEPAAGEALIKVSAVGICGSDMHYYKHGRISNRTIKKPYVIGHEISGVIETIEENDLGLKPGMPVSIEPSIPCGKCELCVTGQYNLCKSLYFVGSNPNYGGMREYMTIRNENLFPLPPSIPVEDGVFIETIAVCVHVMDCSEIKLGNSVAIYGAGNIGLSLLQLSLLSGAFDVFMVDPLEYRLDLAKKMGAAAVINPDKEDPVEKIMSLTNGRGVDIGIEAAGVPETPQPAMNSITPGGVFLFAGIVPESIIQWDTEAIRKKALTIKIIQRSRHGVERAIEVVDRGKFDLAPFITHRFPIDRVQDAFNTMFDYKDNCIKVIVTP